MPKADLCAKCGRKLWSDDRVVLRWRGQLWHEGCLEKHPQWPASFRRYMDEKSAEAE